VLPAAIPKIEHKVQEWQQPWTFSMLLSQKEMYLSWTRRRTAYNLTHIIANITSTRRYDKHRRANYSIVPR